MVRNRNGKVIMTLEKPDLQPVYEMGWKAPERFKVKAADGVTDLYGVMWKPADLIRRSLPYYFKCLSGAVLRVRADSFHNK